MQFGKEAQTLDSRVGDYPRASRQFVLVIKELDSKAVSCEATAERTGSS